MEQAVEVASTSAVAILTRPKLFAHITAGDEARQHNGDVINNTTHNILVTADPPPGTGRRQQEKDAALRLAAKNGQLLRLRHLLRIDADIDSTDDLGCTALHHACQSGADHIVCELINQGADVEAASPLFGTPLCLAALTDRHVQVHFLLGNGARANGEGGEIGSPLHAACAAQCIPSMTALINAGADVEAEKIVDWSLTKHVLYRQMEHKPRQTEMLSVRPLHMATFTGNERIVLHMLDYGAEIDSLLSILAARDSPRSALAALQGSKHETALMLATRFNKTDIVDTLIKGGADLELKNDDGATAAMIAVSYDQVTSFIRLIDAGADYGTMDTEGQSLLMAAVKHDNRSVFQHLLNLGMPLDQQDIRGQCVEHVAADWNRHDYLRLLARAGVSLDSPATDGRTPLLCVAIDDTDTKSLEVILAQRVYVNHQSGRGETAIARAARKGILPAIKLLVEHGADLELRNVHGSTALMQAANWGHTDCVECLLSYGARWDAQNLNGFLAFHFAAREGHISCLELLARAQGDRATAQGAPDPVRLAASHGRTVSVEWLLDNWNSHYSYEILSDAIRDAPEDAADVVELLKAKRLDISEASAALPYVEVRRSRH